MRKRFNTVIVNTRVHEARLLWIDEGEYIDVAAFEMPFSIVHEGKLVDVEIVVEHDVREFALREHQN